MKTSSKRQDKCKVEISVELSAEETLPVIKEVEKAFMRDARLPGFRPGKAPIELVRKNFAAELKEEQARATIRKFYQEATKAEKVEPINLREVTSVKCDRDGGELKFVVEIKPEFKLPQYGITESMNVSVAGGVLMTYLDVFMQKQGREKFALPQAERDALLLDWLDRHVNGIETNSPIVRVEG